MAIFATPTPQIITSVRIARNDVTILKFDKKTNRVLNLYQHPLPEKIIELGEIKDPSKLSAILKVAVTQAKAQGAPSIIGFPEDKAFTITFTATSLDNGDFDESIRWQAEERLPADPQNYVFDWKKLPGVATPSDTSEIVIVAAPKRYLNPLISAVIQSGLKPLSCEPTSVSLGRLIPPNEVSLIGEIRKNQSTLVLVDANGVVRLSSVVESPEAVVKKINAMKLFYAQKYNQSPTAIFLCGEGATPAWIEYVGKNTGIKTLAVPLKAATGSPPNSAAFAVSFSLIQAETTPPKDVSSINLLPLEVQTMYEKVAEKKSLSFGLKFSLISLTLTAIIMATTLILIKIRVQNIQSQIAMEEQSATQISYANLAKTAEAANALSKVVSRLPPQDRLTTIVTELEASLPSGVSIQSYTLDLPENVLLVNGQAPTRDALLLFKANLEKRPVFDLVTIPLPTLERKLDIPYSIAIDLTQPLRTK